MRIRPDSGFVHFMSSVFDAVIATVLFLLCCLPVVTVGAAAAAYHSVMLKVAMGDSTGGAVPFFRAFGENFKLATLLWLPVLLLGGIVAADVYVCFFAEVEVTVFFAVIQGTTIACCLLYGALVSYLFAGISKFEVTWKQALRNAMVWTTRKPLHTLALLVLNVGAVVAFWLGWIWAMPVVILLMYLRAVILNSAFGFKKLPKPKEPDEEIYYE